LLSRERVTAQVVVYIAAIFLTYLTLGVMMIAGIDALLPSLKTIGGGRLEFIVQGLIGLAMLVYAIRTPTTASSAPARRAERELVCRIGPPRRDGDGHGATTAVPYFGAIALLTAADLPIAQWLPLLVLYNAIFVFPPVLLLAGHIVFGARLEARYANLRERLQAGARETMLWIFGIVGPALLFWSIAEYIARS
jgi:hypothetical protein